MTEEVLRNIQKEKMTERGDHIIVGVSGGADSVCLLLVLKELAERLHISLEALHVEHGIRGEESRADARFVRQLCEREKIVCKVMSVDVPAYAASKRLGLEEAARILRYRCYRKAAERNCKEGRKCSVALAHHADDNAETLLFHLIRGSSMDGLGGIRPVRDLMEKVPLIRPLLTVTRAQIEDYLKTRGQTYCVDATNTDLSCSRNRIRHAVFPELCRLNGRAVQHMAGSAAELLQAAEFIDISANNVLKRIRHWEGNAQLLHRGILEYPQILQRRAVYLAIREAAGSAMDLGSVHVSAVLDLFLKQTGKKISLPYGLMAERSYEYVVIAGCGEDHYAVKDTRNCRHGQKTDAASGEEPSYILTEERMRLLEQGETLAVHMQDAVFFLKRIKFSGNMEEITKNKYTKWFDYGKINVGLCIRKPKSGDFLVFDNGGHRKKLKDYMAAEKIPMRERGKRWVIASDSHVLWFVGGRISTFYKVETETEYVLVITNHTVQERQ